MALALDEEASDLAASVWLDLRDRGERIGVADCLIAAITLRHGASLLTRNRRHFERVNGLTLA